MTGLLLANWSTSSAQAESVLTETTEATLTKQQIVAQELKLKEMQNEYDKSQLVKERNEALDLRKAELELDIKKLELLKARRDLMIKESEEQLLMSLEGDVLFDVNSSNIKPSAAPALKQVALVLSQYPQGNVVVTGFADSTGTAQDNMKLSRDRGESVKTYLLEKSNGLISSERVVAQGMGETNPVATNQSSAGRQLNRRVEITITKL